MRNSLQSNDYFGSKMPLLRMAFIIPFPSIPEEALPLILESPYIGGRKYGGGEGLL